MGRSFINNMILYMYIHAAYKVHNAYRILRERQINELKPFVDRCSDYWTLSLGTTDTKTLVPRLLELSFLSVWVQKSGEFLLFICSASLRALRTKGTLSTLSSCYVALHFVVYRSRVRMRYLDSALSNGHGE